MLSEQVRARASEFTEEHSEEKIRAAIKQLEALNSREAKITIDLLEELVDN